MKIDLPKYSRFISPGYSLFPSITAEWEKGSLVRYHLDENTSGQLVKCYYRIARASVLAASIFAVMLRTLEQHGQNFSDIVKSSFDGDIFVFLVSIPRRLNRTISIWTHKHPERDIVCGSGVKLITWQSSSNYIKLKPRYFIKCHADLNMYIYKLIQGIVPMNIYRQHMNCRASETCKRMNKRRNNKININFTSCRIWAFIVAYWVFIMGIICLKLIFQVHV